MNDILIGAIGSLLSIFIIYLFKVFIIPEFNRVVFSHVINIAGKYEGKVIDETRSYNVNSMFIKLNQFGDRVWGILEQKLTTSDDLLKSKIQGRITPQKLFIFQHKSLERNISDFGCGMFLFNYTSKNAKGFILCLCETCTKPHSIEYSLKRL